MNRPQLVMFAGPNGSGKSTITPTFQAQPDFPRNYINPDEIALSLGGNIMERAYEASAIAANRRDECIRNGESFAFETVMSHPSKLALLEKARYAGFKIALVFISTKDPAYNVARVRDRVAQGGHNVPTDKIIARYHRTHTYLPIAIALSHRTYIFDNTVTPQLGAVIVEGEIVERNIEDQSWISTCLDRYLARIDEKSRLTQRNSENPKIWSFSLINESKYTGRVEFIGEYYAVQEISNTEAIFHDLSLINSPLPLKRNIKIKYEDGISGVEIIN